MKFETKAIVLGHHTDPSTGTVIVPIYQGTTFAFDEIGKNTGFEYSRSGNPTRTALERCLAGLEDAAQAISFSSGMAATDAIVSGLKPGDHLVAACNLYGGTLRLFESIYVPRQVKFTYVSGDDMAELEAAITPNTKMIWVETPTNPQLQIIDIAAAAKVAKKAGVLLVVDNTFASPFVQRPLELGADIVLHSTTKYISGHNDVIGGAVLTNDAKFAEQMRFFQNTAGAVPGPFDCYLTLRGIKTLGLRMRAHQENALRVAQFLKTHPMVLEVLYPGLPEHPGHALAKKQMNGFGGMVSFNLAGDRDALNRFVKALRLFHFAESLGGAESLLCHPTTMSHAVLTEEERQKAGITERMIRMSIGIEHGDDLIDDLQQALDKAGDRRHGQSGDSSFV
ncbi:cystathionine gamma-synthase [soil metagenome]